MPSNQKPLKRAIVFPSDIAFFTGRNIRTCRRILDDVRKVLGKSPKEFVTIKDFCRITDTDEELFSTYIRD